MPSPLAVTTVRWMWVGHLVSLVGDHLYRVALVWSITVHGGISSATALGVAMALPAAAAAVVGGVLADKMRRTTVLIWADLGRALVDLILVGLALYNVDHIVPYLLAAALLSVGSGIFGPAQLALLPAACAGDRPLLMGANAWFLGAVNTMRVVGPLIAGLAIVALPLPALFGADALSYVFSALMFVVVRRALAASKLESLPPAPADAAVSTRTRERWREVLEGFRFLGEEPLLRVAVPIFALAEMGIFAIPLVLPALAQQQQLGSEVYGLWLSANAIGTVAGAAVFASLPWLGRRRGVVLAANFVIQGLGLAAFALTASWSLPLSALAMGLTGLPAGAAQVAFFSYLQIEVPDERRGRVMASIMALTITLPVLAQPAFGLLGTLHGPLACIAVAATLSMLGGFVLSSRRVVWSLA